MKNKIFLVMLAIGLLLGSCAEEHLYYNTAAEAILAIEGNSFEVGQPIKFSDQSLPTKGTVIKSYLWEFGDEANSKSTEASPSFTYMKDGTFTVYLTVVDSNNLKSTTKQTIKVVNPTKADFIVDAEEYLIGEEVSFTDKSTTKGSTTIKSWNWNFADANGSTSNEQNPKYKYTEAGVYPVTLTVTDSYGLTSKVSKSITVLDPTKLVNAKWTTVLGGAIKGGSSPALSPDGNAVYMLRSFSGTDCAALVAYSTDGGQELWTLDLSEAIANNGGSSTALCKDVFSSPSVAKDGTIYVVVRDLQSTTANRGLYTIAVAPNKAVKWCKKVGASGANLYAITPAIDGDGNIYVANRSKEIWKLSSTGVTTTFSGLGDITAGVSVSKDGTIYAVGKGNVGLYAVNADGSQKWLYNTDFGGAADAFTGALRSALPSIASDGTIYLTIDKGGAGAIVALNPSGSAKWVCDTPGAIPDGGVVISADGTIYSNGGTDAASGLMAISKGGEIIWKFATEANVQTTPLIDNRGYLHIIDAQANYYVVKPDGKLFGKTKLGSSCVSALVMDNTGRIFTVVEKDGVSTMICATSKATSYSTTAQWAMRGSTPNRAGLQK